MTIKHMVLVSLLVLSGCATTIPRESPICVPVRPVLVDLTVAEQLDILQVSPDLLGKIATNDVNLKSQVRVLEGLIEAHDQPLGSCD